VRELELGDGELKNILLKKLKWELLKQKSPEFIVTMIVKKLRESRVKVLKEKDNKSIVVVPVTQLDDTIVRKSPFVYEFYRGWKGEVLREITRNKVDSCVVKIRRDKNSPPVVTEILKTDLYYGEPGQGGKEEKVDEANRFGNQKGTKGS
jgi:hypothetical protein